MHLMYLFRRHRRDSELAFIYRKLSSFVAVSVFLPYLLP